MSSQVVDTEKKVPSASASTSTSTSAAVEEITEGLSNVRVSSSPTTGAPTTAPEKDEEKGRDRKESVPAAVVSDDEEEESDDLDSIDWGTIPDPIIKFAGWIKRGLEKNKNKSSGGKEGGGCCGKILVLSGAGVSVAAGIPDFRTPGTGLYDNLQKYDLPYPEAVFDVQFFRYNPVPFWSLSCELWPGDVVRHKRNQNKHPAATGGDGENAKSDGSKQQRQQLQQQQQQQQPMPKHLPTLTHSFIAMLEERGLLLRNYTQNIDGLEHLAGVSDGRLVECHGHFRTASCTQCGRAVTRAEYDADIVMGTIAKYRRGVEEYEKEMDRDSASTLAMKSIRPPKCAACGGYVKPDIVFFGEGLPSNFFQSLQHDMKVADCCLVLGTSLQVAPVSHIPSMVGDDCKRVLFNRELVGDFEVHGHPGGGTKDARDLFRGGDCDDSIRLLARALGWEKQLLRKHRQNHETLRSSQEHDEGKGKKKS